MADEQAFKILAFFYCIAYFVIGMLTYLELVDSQKE